MQVSTRFLSLLHCQLAQFADRPDVRSLVVYVTQRGADDAPALVPIGHWPSDGRALPTVEAGSPLRLPAEQRRWLPLRHQNVLLGALQVETHSLPWPEPLKQRLQAVAVCLTEALCLDLEQQRLADSLRAQNEQLGVLVHQLRNPLAALRTFGQLLRRRLDGDPANRSLVDNLLQEQTQINRYLEAIEAIDQGGSSPGLAAAGPTTPLLLPPALQGEAPKPLEEILQPLLQRAAATASLQGRPWVGPGPTPLPAWRGEASAVAEIVANLLENAFRYSRSGGAIGLLCQAEPAAAGRQGPITLTVWDSGPEIPPEERSHIFGRGQRGSTGAGLPGSGLGLALGRDLAEQLGGSLELQIPPAALDPHNPDLPQCGNAFCLRLP